MRGMLEASLADESIYVDPSRKDELTQLVQDPAVHIILLLLTEIIF